MRGKHWAFKLLYAGCVAVALSAAAVVFTGCPDEPEPWAPDEPAEPAEPGEPIDPDPPIPEE